MSDKKFEKKDFEIKGVGTATRMENGDFVVTDKTLMEAYEANGVPDAKSVLKTVYDARDNIVTSLSKFALEQVRDDMRVVSLRAGTGNNRIDITGKPEEEFRNPMTQEKCVKYGSVSIKIRNKVPEAIENAEGEFRKLLDDIEKRAKSGK